MDCIELDLSNITNINKFLKRNHMRVNVPNLDKISLLKNLEKYGSDKYLALQESHNLNLYDKLVKRRVAVEVTNKARFEFWKYLFQERISTVLASPELKSLMKHVSEMNLDEHLEFMAGVNQMLHDCSKSALHEVYRIINESAHASYSELKFEVEDLKQLNCRIESVIAKKKDELEKMKQRKKQLEELEKYAEEKRRQLNEINRKIDEANQRRAELSQLNEKLAEQKKALELQLNGGNKAKKVAEKVRYSTVALNRSVGVQSYLMCLSL
ncbi:unnamed protein product [Heterobilharzia americana]|nr:unnamed protein product [Heterobilharzia americana]